MKQQVLSGQHSSATLTDAAMPKLKTVVEDPYIARLLAPDDAALLLCWQLRYRYFVRERGWVLPTELYPDEERDRYDQHAWHLAVWEDDQVVAYLRVLPWRADVGFMLEDDFQTLMPASTCKALPRQNAVELSRLVCCPQSAVSKESGAPHALELLLKLLYHLALREGIEQFHIVVEAAWLKPFARRFGLPFTPLGEVQVLAGGTRTIAATATLGELQTAMLRRWPDKYAWYHNQSANNQ